MIHDLAPTRETLSYINPRWFNRFIRVDLRFRRALGFRTHCHRCGITQTEVAWVGLGPKAMVWLCDVCREGM
jgi:hypothetical protein